MCVVEYVSSSAKYSTKQHSRLTVARDVNNSTQPTISPTAHSFREQHCKRKGRKAALREVCDDMEKKDPRSLLIKAH